MHQSLPLFVPFVRFVDLPFCLRPQRRLSGRAIARRLAGSRLPLKRLKTVVALAGRTGSQNDDAMAANRALQHSEPERIPDARLLQLVEIAGLGGAWIFVDHREHPLGFPQALTNAILAAQMLALPARPAQTPAKVSSGRHSRSSIIPENSDPD